MTLNIQNLNKSRSRSHAELNCGSFHFTYIIILIVPVSKCTAWKVILHTRVHYRRGFDHIVKEKNNFHFGPKWHLRLILQLIKDLLKSLTVSSLEYEFYVVDFSIKIKKRTQKKIKLTKQTLQKKHTKHTSNSNEIETKAKFVTSWSPPSCLSELKIYPNCMPGEDMMRRLRFRLLVKKNNVPTRFCRQRGVMAGKVTLLARKFMLQSSGTTRQNIHT